MSHRKVKRTRCASRTAFVTAISPAFLAIGMPAAAQDTPAADDLEEVVVTGFRAALESALNRKRSSTQVIESITPEDLGKFPDQNIAESLQRLSGVQIDRVAGQGTNVRIRGLSQNVLLLDGDLFQTGLELFKLGEGNNRFNDSLESVPSELISGVDVYKSSSADLVEGALGGTINFRTRRAIDGENGWTLGGNVNFNQGDYLDDVEPGGTAIAAFNRDGRFGVTATVTYSKQNYHEDEIAGNNRGNWRWVNSVAGRAGPVPGSIDPGNPDEGIFDGNGAVAPHIEPELMYTNHRDQYRERIGASVGIDWKPADSLTLGLDWFHSDLEFSTEEIGNKVWFTSNNLGLGPDPALPLDIDANGVVRSGTFRALGAEVISFVQAAEAKADNFQLSLDYDNEGPVTGSFKFAHSESTMISNSGNSDVQHAPYSVPTPDPASPTGFSHQPSFNPTAPGGANGAYSFAYSNGGGTLPEVSYLGTAADILTNPAYAFFKSHWAFGDRSDIESDAARADIQFDPSDSRDGKVVLSAGFRFSKRDVDFVSGRYLIDWSSNGEYDASGDPVADGGGFGPWFYFQDGAIGNKGCDVPALSGLTCGRFSNSPPIVTPFQSATTNPERIEVVNSFFPSGNVGGQIIAQSRAQMRNPVAWLQSLYPSQPMEFFRDEPESFLVSQQTTAFYLMADLGNNEDRYHVNVGARFVDTGQEVEQHGPAPGGRIWGSDTWNGVVQDFTTTIANKQYSDVLPSMNLTFDVTDAQKVRFSAARIMSRPDLYTIGRGFQTFFTRESNDNNNDGDTDDAGENGFRFTGGSAGNPDLDPFRATSMDLSYEWYFGQQNALIATLFRKEVDSFIGTRTAPEVVQDDFGGTAGAVTRPFNAQGGSIFGFEVGAQYLIDFGLGFVANYTRSNSSSPVESSFDTNLPIFGVSKDAYNAQVYFDKAGFATRLSYAWRSGVVTGLFGFDGATYGVFSRDYGQLDGSISYQINDKFGVALEGLNLTEEERSQYLQFPNQPFTYQSGERRLVLTVRARL
jgi:iron complex outermembrane recepter protein